MKIEAIHHFEDAAASQAWSDKWQPNEHKLRLFNDILAQLPTQDVIHVVELGIGPGYLANHLLSHAKSIQYLGLDISQPMLDIAKERNNDFADSISFQSIDMTNKKWSDEVNITPDVIVTTWALHDLFNPENIFNVYLNAQRILAPNGILLNGDFIKPEKSTFEYEGGRIKPSLHLELLRKAGFSSADCIGEYEMDLHNPTTANNYVCFKAIK